MFCGKCGAARVEGDDFCQTCGAPYGAGAPATATATAEPPPPDPLGPVGDDPPFPSWAPLAAGVLTFFAPFISLIVALVMRSGEHRPRRRGFLKGWAIASGAWLCTGWIVALIVFGCASSAASGCKGGPEPFGVGSYQSSDNVHWTETVPCVNGGSTTRSVPASQVPGGGGP